MKLTTLYLHDSTACWMQWRGKRLLNVYCESVTRELAERAASSSKKDGIHTLCPWVNSRSPQVKLLIDPVADQTQFIPAFDYGFTQAHGTLDRLRQRAEQMYLTCRSLTSDVLADDLTRYRHDRLKKYPNALLQWHEMKTTQPNSKAGGASHWLVSDSGLSDYAFSWLKSMADNGLEIVDVQAVCALYAYQDAHIECPVISILVQSNRCRLIQCKSGFVTKVEQWNNTVEARIALQESVSALTEDGQEVVLSFVGCQKELEIWQQALPDHEITKRVDGIIDLANYSGNITDHLPDACLKLPLNALVSKSSGMSLKFWSNRPHWEAGGSIRNLLSIARWKRRHKQAVIATTLAAVFSGYFVLLACMHAVDMIELHQRAKAEILSLKTRHSVVEMDIQNMSKGPDDAVLAIEKLNGSIFPSNEAEQKFLLSFANLINKQSSISIDSLSWRVLDPSHSEKELVNVLAEIGELRHVNLNTLRVKTNELGSERLLLISGSVGVSGQVPLSHQQSSDELISFLQSLTDQDQIVEVIPINDFLSNSALVNLPSDVVISEYEESGFVLAVRVVV